jgi:hypothetical protein
MTNSKYKLKPSRGESLNYYEQAMIFIIVSILQVDVKPLAILFSDIKSKRIKTRGINDTILYLKSLYTTATRISLGMPFEPLNFCKSDKNNVPKDLKKFLPYLKGSVNEKRAALTVLAQYRTLHRNSVDTNLSTIVGENSLNTQMGIKHITKKFDLFIRSFMDRIKKPCLERMVPHFTSKAGPNGPHALLRAHEDALALSNLPILSSIKKVIEQAHPEDT